MTASFAARVRAETSAHYHYSMGLALLVSGEGAAAQAALERAGTHEAALWARSWLRELPVCPATPEAARAGTRLWYDLGHLLERRGRSPEALRCFEVALSLSPDDSETFTSLGDSLRRLGQLDAARAAYRRAIAIENPWGVRAPEDGEPGRAVIRLRDLAEDDIRLAEALELQGQMDAARASWQAATTTNPEAARSWAGLAQALAAHSETLHSAEAQTETRAEAAAAWHQAAVLWQQHGVFDEAEAALSRALILSPQSRSCVALAELNQRRGLKPHARHLRRLALVLDPADAENWYRLGLDCAAAAREDLAVSALEAEARAAFQLALILAPDRVGARNGLAELCIVRSDFDDAETEYRAALAIRPHGVWSLVGLGNLLLLREQTTEAEALARQALARVPDFAEARLLLGRCLLNQGQVEAARAVLIAAYDSPLPRVTTQAELASILPHVDACDEAAALLDRLGGRLLDDGKPEAAARIWRQALCLRPNCAAAHAGLGYVHERCGPLESALEAWERALCLKPERGDWHQARARTLETLNRPDEAAAARRAALEADCW